MKLTTIRTIGLIALVIVVLSAALAVAGLLATNASNDAFNRAVLNAPPALQQAAVAGRALNPPSDVLERLGSWSLFLFGPGATIVLIVTLRVSDRRMKAGETMAPLWAKRSA